MIQHSLSDFAMNACSLYMRNIVLDIFVISLQKHSMKKKYNSTSESCKYARRNRTMMGDDDKFISQYIFLVNRVWFIPYSYIVVGIYIQS